ncbi:MAG: hypothetical protein HY301_03565 [Verrucomicrobia bacterium]|nr:hypothetical protein [Verrucomicrobiota bacterium]
MKAIIPTLLAAAALGLLAACSTTGHQHAMGCGKCACMAMTMSDADAHTCKMCGHADTDHNVAKPDAHKH